MDSALHAELLALDEPGRLEISVDPTSSFSWELAAAIAHELSELVARPLAVDRNVQDASFLTDIGLLDERRWDRVTRSGVTDYEFSFRLSNFGYLFTLHGTRLSEWSHICDRGVRLIQVKGGRYVPADALQLPYDGSNVAALPGETWWTRYFDYV